MSDLGDQLQDEIDAILALETAAEKGTGEDGDPFADEIDAYVQEAQRVFDNAAPDTIRNSDGEITADIDNTSTNTEELFNTAIAKDGAHLETLVSNLSPRDCIWLKPNTTYSIDSTLEVADVPFFAIGCPLPTRQSAIIKPTGDFSAFDIHGTLNTSDYTDHSGWIGQWAVSNIGIDTTNITSSTDVFLVDASRFFYLSRISIFGGGGRDGFHFGGPADADRFSGFEVLNCHAGATSRYALYCGASSTARFRAFDAFGGTDYGIYLEDANEVWLTDIQAGNQDGQVSINAVNRWCRDINITNHHSETAPTTQTIDVNGSGDEIRNLNLKNVVFGGSDTTGAQISGTVSGVNFENCLWMQTSIGTCIDVADTATAKQINVSPNQTLYNDVFPVVDSNGVIEYGWGFDNRNVKNYANVNGEIYPQSIPFVNDWQMVGRDGSNAIAVLDNSGNSMFRLSGAGIGLEENDLIDFPKYSDDTNAASDSLYYDTTDNQLEYKDPGGTIHPLG